MWAVGTSSSSSGFSMPLLVAAAAAALAWLGAVGAVIAWRRPPRVDPVAMAPGELPEPPAVAGLLCDDFTVGGETAPATLLDLAARRVVVLDEVQPGETVCRLRARDTTDLTPYEEMVLDQLRAKALDGVVPAGALDNRNRRRVARVAPQAREGGRHGRTGARVDPRPLARAPGRAPRRWCARGDRAPLGRERGRRASPRRRGGGRRGGGRDRRPRDPRGDHDPRAARPVARAAARPPRDSPPRRRARGLQADAAGAGRLHRPPTGRRRPVGPALRVRRRYRRGPPRGHGAPDGRRGRQRRVEPRRRTLAPRARAVPARMAAGLGQAPR